jgi:hypothetical protein
MIASGRNTYEVRLNLINSLLIQNKIFIYMYNDKSVATSQTVTYKHKINSSSVAFAEYS